MPATDLHKPDGVDVLVIGSGPAGCATSIELARAGLSVAMMERADAGGREHAGETLSSDVVPSLVHLGVWDAFRARNPRPCFGMRSAWGSPCLEAISGIVSPYGHGWHVDRRWFDSLLIDAARTSGVSVCQQARGETIRRDDESSWLTVADSGYASRRLAARFLVDASGRTSPLRTRLGATDHVHDHLIGIGAWFTLESKPDHSDQAALISATEQGWWYCAPTWDAEHRVAVFMTDLDLYRKRSSVEDFFQQRIDECAHVSEWLLGSRQSSPIRTYIASSHQVIQLGQPGWLPVGDAMQSVDPLTGRGVTNAIQSSIDAAAAIAGAVKGEPHRISEFLRSSQRAFTQYLLERLETYGVEVRWRDATFWRRRMDSRSEAIVAH